MVLSYGSSIRLIEDIEDTLNKNVRTYNIYMKTAMIKYLGRLNFPMHFILPSQT